MHETFNPSLERIIAVHTWGDERCLGFAADSSTLLSPIQRIPRCDCGKEPRLRCSRVLDELRYTYCGTLPAYRGFIVLEHDDTISQLYHWDIDDSLHPILAPLPPGRLVEFLPNEQYVVFSDRQWRRSLLTFPAWKLVMTFPAVWDDYAVNSEYFAYKSNGTFTLWSFAANAVVSSFQFPHTPNNWRSAASFDASGQHLIVEGRYQHAFSLWRCPIASVLRAQPDPLGELVFSSQHSDYFGSPTYLQHGRILLLPITEPHATLLSRYGWERWDLQTGQPLPCPKPPVTFRRVAVSPDERTFLFMTDAGSFCFWSADELPTALTPLIHAHEDADEERLGLSGYLWSPDSHWLVTSGTNRRAELDAMGFVPADDAISSHPRTGQHMPPDMREDYVYATKLWRVRS